MEITRILERNRDDGAFVREMPGAEVFYVFDTNVVQMFFEPFRNPQHAELFHSSIWGNDFEEFDSVNRQACLLIGEYMMSGGLPGQARSHNWYMSTPHFGELEVQIDWLEKEIRENIVRLDTEPDFQRRALLAHGKIRETLALDPMRDREAILDLAARHGEGPAEAAELQKLPADLFADRAAAIRSRELCRLMAKDRIFEPVDQLNRFRTADLVGRMRPIEGVFAPNRDALEIIDDEQAKWSEALIEAVAQRPKNSRTDAALKNDSRTLAHLSWAMRYRAEAHQKIVLVTGDRALYDAYRQRFIDEEDDLPFLLRPLVQFAPLFNPTTAKSATVDREEIFEGIRRTIEAATVGLSLSLFGRTETETRGKVRARDHFILRSERPEAAPNWIMKALFPGLHDDRLLRSHDKNLVQLVPPLQRVEKLMLGAFPHLLASRIEERAERQTFLQTASANGPGLSEALQSRLDLASRRAFMFSVPLLPNVIMTLLHALADKEGGLIDRARVSVRFTFPTSQDWAGGAVTYKVLGRTEILSQLKTSGSALPGLLLKLSETPSRIFALAAMLAITAEDWDKAAHHAELAATAAENAGDRFSDDDDYYELLYLRATSLRFRMSSYAPDPAKAYHDHWAQWLRAAEASLQRCATRHAEKFETAREIRSYSERAAVRLAYCEWSAFGHLSGIRMRQDDRSITLDAFEGAVEDLRACWRLLPDAERRASQHQGDGPNFSGETLEAARFQFKVNSAVAHLVAIQLRRKGYPAAHLEGLTAGLPRPAAWSDTQVLQPMTRAYIFAFQKRWTELRELESHALSLPLDTTVIRALQGWAEEELAGDDRI